MERSEKILQGLGNQYYRATLKSMGFTTEDLKRPVIGIANAWSECVPGHYNLRQVAQRVKDGIYRAGGTPIEFGVIGGCDGMGQGHDGMHYILPSRELIANSIESMAQINLFDGLVLLGSCDKIVPGMLMAAARLDIPCIFLPGGPMEGGVEFDGRQARPPAQRPTACSPPERSQRRSMWLSRTPPAPAAALAPIWVLPIPCALWPRLWA